MLFPTSFQATYTVVNWGISLFPIKCLFQATYTVVNKALIDDIEIRDFQATYTVVNSKLMLGSSHILGFKAILMNYTIIFLDVFKALDLGLLK